MINLIRNTINEFCQAFIQNPYMCYSEHGQHALFYNMLYQAIPKSQRVISWENQKICVVQKEYPTAGKLGKPRRQHWDIAIIKSPPESISSRHGSYDYFKLYAAIEFGMNESEEHLQDDINRLCHEGSNIEHRFIIHLYRLSESGARFSGRDWSSKSPRILNGEKIKELIKGKPVEIFYGLADSTGKHKCGVWSVSNEL